MPALSSAIVRLFHFANFALTQSIEAPVSGKARMLVSVFLLPGFVMQTLRFTIGVGEPVLCEASMLTEFFPFLMVDTTDRSSYDNFVLLGFLFLARMMQ